MAQIHSTTLERFHMGRRNGEVVFSRCGLNVRRWCGDLCVVVGASKVVVGCARWWGEEEEMGDGEGEGGDQTHRVTLSL